MEAGVDLPQFGAYILLAELLDTLETAVLFVLVLIILLEHEFGLHLIHLLELAMSLAQSHAFVTNYFIEYLQVLGASQVPERLDTGLKALLVDDGDSLTKSRVHRVLQEILPLGQDWALCEIRLRKLSLLRTGSLEIVAQEQVV